MEPERKDSAYKAHICSCSALAANSAARAMLSAAFFMKGA
jgi:hypothetical protein